MARLPQGVRKRPNGMLEKRFTVNKNRYSVYATNTRELAEKEQELREQIKAGEYIKNRNITLDQFYNKWIEGRRNQNKGNSLHTYSNIYTKHIKRKFGKRKLINIERRECTEFQKELAKDLKPTTVNYILSVLNILLNDAVREEIITRNPAKGIKSIKVTEKATETYHRALTEHEQSVFMRELKGSYYYNFIALMLCSGMRAGEVAALTWGDIDQVNQVIHINKTVTKTEAGALVTGSPKTEAGRRDIPITLAIKEILISQKQTNDLLQFPTNLIFTTARGNIVPAHQVNDEIRRVIKKAAAKGEEIEIFTSHALRDTFATRFIEQGGTPQTLKTILGHSSLTMTMDLYAHVMPNTKSEEMNKIIINF